MILFAIVVFFIALLLLILCASAIGSNNYGFAGAYLFFCLVVCGIGLFFMISLRVDPLEEQCTKLGGFYSKTTCFDFNKAPTLPLVP